MTEMPYAPLVRWWADDGGRGVRASFPILLPTLALGVTFGVLGAPLVGTLATVVMSAVVWSGTAQFAALTALSGGAGVLTAGGSALLANLRFLPMGVAIAPSLRGGRLRRAAAAATLVDASFAIAHRGEGRFDIPLLVGAAPLQYLGWLVGTVLGATGSGFVGDPARWGLDVLFPIFYVSLLLPDLRQSARRPWMVAGLAGLTTVALTPVTPPGVPVMAASLAALVGLRGARA
jgi:predicted branched-subunit amino acid permease